MNKLNETEKAYIAGFIDGEGYISIQRTVRRRKDFQLSIYYQLTLKIGNTDLEVLKYINDVTGVGEIHLYDYEYADNIRRKPVYDLQICGKKAQNLLNEILPYLHTKKESAKIFLKFNLSSKFAQANCQITRLSEKEKISRAILYSKIREMHSKKGTKI